MRTLQTITDPTFTPKAQRNAVEKFFLHFIADERDLPFIWLCLKLIFILMTSAILLFTPLYQGWIWWAMATFHLLMMAIYFLGPFTLMLHNTSHRRFFKQEYNIGNYIIPWVIGPFMGQSPDTYYGHHIGMHHSENNLKDDLSSTMKYRRDNIFHFLHYFFTFFFIGLVQLVRYFTWKRRYDFVRKVLSGETFFILMCIGLCFVNWRATLFVFMLPFFIIRFGMMAGNWAQHAFVDPNDPANNYLNSITCINSVYNQKCFNDGYHIGHHLRPHMHWTDMASDFVKNSTKYAENKALVFEKLDFFVIWFFLMIRRHDILVDHLVNINGMYKSEEEAYQVIEERLRPC